MTVYNPFSHLLNEEVNQTVVYLLERIECLEQRLASLEGMETALDLSELGEDWFNNLGSSAEGSMPHESRDPAPDSAQTIQKGGLDG